MSIQSVSSGDATIHARCDGASDPAAPTVVLANALGTNLHLWDGVLPHLPPALRIIRHDMRGHGRSSVPPGPYSMGALIADAEAVCDSFAVRDAVMVGLCVGGLVAQGLAVKRLDLLRGLVLSNTAARIGHPGLWADRIATVTDTVTDTVTETVTATVPARGLEPLADDILTRWFGRDFRAGPDLPQWRSHLLQTSPRGYAGVCAAISGTDFFTTTATLRLPTLGIAGSEDAVTPPDLVRETLDLIPGSRLVLMRRAGHLPCVEAPAAYAAHLTGFLHDIGHL